MAMGGIFSHFDFSRETRNSKPFLARNEKKTRKFLVLVPHHISETKRGTENLNIPNRSSYQAVQLSTSKTTKSAKFTEEIPSNIIINKRIWNSITQMAEDIISKQI